MLNTELEFSFLRLCFDKPSLFVLPFHPLDRQVEWVHLQIEKYIRKFHSYPTYPVFVNFLKERCEAHQYDYILDKMNNPLSEEYTEDSVIRFLEKT
jgi:hypothetical protein